jgi:hypothetical protein
MALLQNIIDTEVNAKRYAESNALIKEPFEVCPPNRVAAMHRTVALQESLRAEGALRDHTARNLSYYGPSGVGQTPATGADFPEPAPGWQPASLSSREAMMGAYHTYPFYRRFWNEDDLLSRQYTPELWEREVHHAAAVNELGIRAQPDMTERKSTNQQQRQEANSKFEAGVAGHAYLVAQRQAEMDQNLQTNQGLPFVPPSVSYNTAPPYGMYQSGYIHPHAAFDEAFNNRVTAEHDKEAPSQEPPAQ